MLMREDWGKVELFRIQIGTCQVASLCDLSSTAVLPPATPFVLGIFENAYEKAQRASLAAGSLRAADSPWVCLIVG